MAELRRDLPDGRLDGALRELGAEIAFPPTPELAATVRARILDASRRRAPFQPRPGLVRRLGLALLALLLAAAIGLALSPTAREAAADRLGLKGLRLFYVPSLPSPTPAPAAPTTIGAGLGLGEETTLAGAQSRAGRPILRPHRPDLGEPDAVFVQTPPAGGQVWLVYGRRPGLPESRETGVAVLFSELRGGLAPEFLGKGLGPRSRLEAVAVNGGRGYWIEGEPHALIFRRPDGDLGDDAFRLAGNTLVWEQDDRLLRLESALGKEAALEIAETVH